MVNKRPTKAKSKGNDDFEVNKRIAKDLEKTLNGIERHPKLIAKQLIGESITKLKYKNKKQKDYCELIGEKEIVICIGPAGCGKSYLAVYKAFQLLLDMDNNYNEIVISTPAVEADEKLGFLPGSIEEKLDPYVYSTYYLMEKLIGKSALDSLIEKKVIKLLAFAFMRGINIDRSIVLIEEAQNTSIKQMKTLLTRIGEDTKFIISGDMKQSDRFKTKQANLSGLYFAHSNLGSIDEIGLYEFDEQDIVRNPVIGKIIKIFEDNDY